jgi:SAM-dependent methyltransferase
MQHNLHAEIEARHWWFAGRRRIVCGLVRHALPPASGARLLDVGCGTGANLAALAKDYACLGVDASPRAIDLARARFPGVAYRHVQEVGETAELATDVDCVLLMDVLEHVEDDFHLLSSLLAPLRTGAHALLTVPAGPELWSRHDVSFGHFRRYVPERLRAVWAGLPVTVRLDSYFNARLYPLIRVAREANRRLARTSGAQGTDFHMPPAPVNRWLASLFAGETRPLLSSIDRGRPAYRRGASLIVLLRREEGPIAPRTRPAGTKCDTHYRRALTPGTT